MIVSRRHAFIFFHNPKAAGTSVRAALERFNDGPRFWGIREINGRPVDLAHQTPAEFAADFPDVWVETRDYEKHCIVRDPLARFHSSVRQYWRNFGGFNLSLARSDEIRRAVFDAIAMLEPYGRAERIPDRPELAHFKAQSLFAAQGVRAWFRIPDLLGHLARRTGAPVPEERRHASVSYPAPVRILARNDRVRAWLGKVPGTNLVKTMLSRRQPMHWTPDDQARIVAFVANFYQADAAYLQGRQIIPRDMIAAKAGLALPSAGGARPAAPGGCGRSPAATPGRTGRPIE